MNACTHKPIWNAHRDNRDECSAIKVEATCTTNGKCAWVPWTASPLDLTACVPLTAPALIKTDWHCGDSNALKADGSPAAGFSTGGTLADCASECAQDASCRWFDWTASSSRCELKKEGCVGAAKTGTQAYRPAGHTDAMCELHWYKVLPGGSNPTAQACGGAATGNEITTTAPTTTLAECKKACSDSRGTTAGCVNFAWTSTTSTCTLYSEACSAEAEATAPAGTEIYGATTECGCNEANLLISSHDDKVYSMLECDQLCFENDYCSEFFRTDAGFCSLYKPGCTHKLEAGSKCYKPSPHTKPSLLGLTCTH